MIDRPLAGAVPRAAVRAFAGRGERLALVGRNLARLARAEQRVRAAGAAAVTSYPADFASLAEVRALGAALRGTRDEVVIATKGGAGTLPGPNGASFAYPAAVGVLAGVRLRRACRGDRCRPAPART